MCWYYTDLDEQFIQLENFLPVDFEVRKRYTFPLSIYKLHIIIKALYLHGLLDKSPLINSPAREFWLRPDLDPVIGLFM